MAKKFLFLFFFTLIAQVFMSSNASAEKGTATLTATSSSSIVSGMIVLEDTPKGLSVKAQFKQASPGNHGFHIHEFGDCSNKGAAAGSHYNPQKSPHGNILQHGPKHAHAGDLGNVLISEDGTGSFEAVIPGLTLSNSANTAGGRAFIFHEKADDFGQPVGNAGSREGCGVITITAN